VSGKISGYNSKKMNFDDIDTLTNRTLGSSAGNPSMVASNAGNWSLLKNRKSCRSRLRFSADLSSHLLLPRNLVTFFYSSTFCCS
jgi:hypothetical protein